MGKPKRCAKPRSPYISYVPADNVTTTTQSPSDDLYSYINIPVSGLSCPRTLEDPEDPCPCGEIYIVKSSGTNYQSVSNDYGSWGIYDSLTLTATLNSSSVETYLHAEDVYIESGQVFKTITTKRSGSGNFYLNKYSLQIIDELNSAGDGYEDNPFVFNNRIKIALRVKEDDLIIAEKYFGANNITTVLNKLILNEQDFLKKVNIIDKTLILEIHSICDFDPEKCLLEVDPDNWTTTTTTTTTTEDPGGGGGDPTTTTTTTTSTTEDPGGGGGDPTTTTTTTTTATTTDPGSDSWYCYRNLNSPYDYQCSNSSLAGYTQISGPYETQNECNGSCGDGGEATTTTTTTTTTTIAPCECDYLDCCEDASVYADCLSGYIFDCESCECIPDPELPQITAFSATLLHNRAEVCGVPNCGPVTEGAPPSGAYIEFSWSATSTFDITGYVLARGVVNYNSNGSITSNPTIIGDFYLSDCGITGDLLSVNNGFANPQTFDASVTGVTYSGIPCGRYAFYLAAVNENGTGIFRLAGHTGDGGAEGTTIRVGYSQFIQGDDFGSRVFTYGGDRCDELGCYYSPISCSELGEYNYYLYSVTASIGGSDYTNIPGTMGQFTFPQIPTLSGWYSINSFRETWVSYQGNEYEDFTSNNCNDMFFIDPN